MITIENDEIIVGVDLKGAELKSIYKKNDNREYLWQGGKGWSRSSPVLFPNIGSLCGNVLRSEGKDYKSLPHGFARDMDFIVAIKDKDSVLLELHADENTFAYYPYRFCLQIGYTLYKSQVEIRFAVINKDDKMVYFSIGAHPAFNLLNGTAIGDYYVKFDKVIELKTRKVCGRFLSDDMMTIGKPADKVELSADLLKKDTLVFEKTGAQTLTLCHKNSDYSVKVGFKDFPIVALWSNPEYINSAKFLCIEPWCGINSFVSDEVEPIDKKYLINSVDINEEWERAYTIEV